MRSINKPDVGEKLLKLLDEKEPIDEDIIILDESGEIHSAIITKEAYDFFLRKVEEVEDEIDSQTVEEFHRSGEKDGR
ncbi:hypothetical protein SG34_006045 [Thalassomonas viridans]|uniref:Uncharacterized protein n=1 Tax=Thalassomonas viridans TaxID=137584 RepID=A0AAF0CB86_9GAMM|nr:hypothetical protein [Thalassomonas viridans]WDE06479.1 hypothetical protein SG34_006045 [Thalassomonas viridans]